jgi:nitrogen fixation protein
MSAPEHMVPLRSIHNPAMVVEQRKVVKGSIMLSLLWNLSVKCPYFHCCSV